MSPAERTCYSEARRAAGDGPQAVDGGDALVGPLIGLVVLGVDHVVEEQDAVGEDVPPLVRHQAHEGAVFLPFDACGRGRVAVGRAVEHGRVAPDGQRVLGLHREPEGGEGLRCWTWGTTEEKTEMRHLNLDPSSREEYIK